jgi:prohibitin 1
MADKALVVMSRVGMGLGALALIPATCLFDVDGGKRVVMLNMFSGVEEKVRGEGTTSRFHG